MATRWKFNSRSLPLIATACGLAVCIAVLVTPRLGSISANGISSHSSIPEQGIRETDRDFLDDMARKNNQDDHGDDNSLPDPDRNTVKVGTIAENLKAVRRAELVEGTENERHKAKVIHSETPSSKVRPKSDRRSLVGSE
jgi:hypothetical protein